MSLCTRRKNSAAFGLQTSEGCQVKVAWIKTTKGKHESIETKFLLIICSVHPHIHAFAPLTINVPLSMIRSLQLSIAVKRLFNNIYFLIFCILDICKSSLFTNATIQSSCTCYSPCFIILLRMSHVASTVMNKQIIENLGVIQGKVASY